MATVIKTRKVIGTYTLDQAKTFRKTYECAAWYTDIRVPAGIYEVTTDGYWIFVELPGNIVTDYFQSLYCGTSIGETYDQKQNAGKESRYVIQTEEYMAKKDSKFNLTSN